MKVLEEPFGGLAKRLTAADRGFDRTVRQALDNTADDGREILREEMYATGAPEGLHSAVHIFREDPLSRAIGIGEQDDYVQTALDYEFGGVQMEPATRREVPVPPSATFRMMGPQLAEWAGDDIAGELEDVVAG